LLASPKIIGIAVGLLAAATVLLTDHPRRAPSDTGAMLSECDGSIESIVIQYVTGADFTLPIYRQFLAALPSSVRVYAVCPGEADLSELQSALTGDSHKLVPIFTRHAMTPWSRDRWIALHGDRGPGTTLAVPLPENEGAQWPARAGDARIAADIAHALDSAVRWKSAGLYLDAGDLLADAQNVFVTAAVLHRNIQHTVQDRAELQKTLEKLTAHKVIFLDQSPDHHAGMYMMAAGEGRVVVGDPSLARNLLSPVELPGGADFSSATQERFDSVAKATADAGYRVTRIPTVPASDGKTYLTYLNGIIDQRNGQRTIYLPSYDAQDRLNSAAKNIWEKLGYRVVPINVTAAFRRFGTLHCLVNVLERSEPSDQPIQVASDSAIR
jgi:hypothetical protein